MSHVLDMQIEHESNLLSLALAFRLAYPLNGLTSNGFNTCTVSKKKKNRLKECGQK